MLRKINKLLSLGLSVIITLGVVSGGIIAHAQNDSSYYNAVITLQEGMIKRNNEIDISLISDETNANTLVKNLLNDAVSEKYKNGAKSATTWLFRGMIIIYRHSKKGEQQLSI